MAAAAVGAERPEEIELLEPKKEPADTVPKSSTEILSELFGVFNAKPPSITDEIVADKNDKKHKKHKKKAKHKKKKKKKSQKRGRSDSDDSGSESDSNAKSKKSKHKKRKRKPTQDDSDSDSESVKSKKGKENDGAKKPRKSSISVKIENNIKVEKEPADALKMNDIPIPKTPDLSTIKLPEEDKAATEEKPAEKSEQKTSSNKIQIKNLKFSSVYEATVKQVEEEARKKAEKYEDGELSETSASTDEDRNRIPSEEDIPEEEPAKVPDLREKLTSKNTEKHSSKNNGKEKSSKKEKDKNSHRSRSRSRTRAHKSSRKKSPTKSRRSTSRSRRSASKSKRSASKSPQTSRSRSRLKTKNRKSTSRSRSRHHREKYDDKRSHRRRSKEKDSRIDIDKKRLLEIARKNAITMLQTGSLPTTANLGTQLQKNVITAIKCGGKSVDELTDFCKNLSRQEAIGELSSVSSNSDGEGADADALMKPFNNPFQIKDRAPIVLNIKGGTNLPTQSFQEKTIEQTKVLRQQFPVSSGSQHRGAENEWRPVSPPTVPPASSAKASTKYMGMSSDKINYSSHSASSNHSSSSSVPQSNTLPVPAGPQVFPSEVGPPVDISSIVSQRLTAIRKLQQDPNDPIAQSQMYQVNQEMSKWAQSKQEPGLFTGSTGAHILTPKELASGYQAWAKRDQLQTAAPVNSGMGMHLLQKMGWKPGEGLGKQKNGALTPLLLEVKLDTRGLVAKEETRQRSNAKRPYVPTVKTLAGKHPVSLLGEYCSKRKLGVPSYNLCFECGPDHKKNFLFKVTVNGIEYQPSVASANKKQAKADAAMVCLQKLGLIQ